MKDTSMKDQQRIGRVGDAVVGSLQELAELILE